MKFFQARKSAYHTNARLLDEVIYTPYSYESNPVKQSTVHARGKVGDILGIPELQAQEDGIQQQSVDTNPVKKRKKFDAGGGKGAEIFMFEYGTVVLWGMTEAEEKRFLSSM